CARAIPADVW
nr:immunoglobulin heavy chain junction region [Macaca mulatta]